VVSARALALRLLALEPGQCVGHAAQPEGLPWSPTFSFGLKSNDERHVTVRLGENVLVERPETLRTLREVTFSRRAIAPGDTVWRFDDRPVREFPANGDRAAWPSACAAPGRREVPRRPAPGEVGLGPFQPRDSYSFDVGAPTPRRSRLAARPPQGAQEGEHFFPRQGMHLHHRAARETPVQMVARVPPEAHPGASGAKNENRSRSGGSPRGITAGIWKRIAPPGRQTRTNSAM